MKLKVYIKYCAIYDLITVLIIIGLILAPFVLKANHLSESPETLEPSKTNFSEKINYC
jgi:hypothetical protein